MPLAERFWSHVDKSGDCWPWLAGVTPNNYGKFARTCDDSLAAHRMAYELTYGPIPDGIMVCHTCDAKYPPGDITYRRCVRPEHLFLGTNQDNILDAVRKGRAAVGERSGTRLHPERVSRGEGHYAARLTDAQIVEICTRCANGEIKAKLGIEYGVSSVLIGKVARREIWKHVEVTIIPQKP